MKCFLDDPEAESPFTVDVMPALRQPSGPLLVPEKASECWILTNPELLIARVADRQGDWSLFRPLVRVLKMWNDCHDTSMKSLTVEVLALERLAEESNRPRALQRFFTAAEPAIDSPIEDPAGLCGPTQHDLDRERAHAQLSLPRFSPASSRWTASGNHRSVTRLPTQSAPPPAIIPASTSAVASVTAHSASTGTRVQPSSQSANRTYRSCSSS